jgi:hypothetical protein
MHLMTFGDVYLDFYDVDKRVARIEIVRASLLRWPERWKSDAVLVDATGLADFLHSRRFGRLREIIDQDLARAKELREQHAAWTATWEPAIPPGLAPLIDGLEGDKYSPEPKALPSALAILERQYESRDEQVLALLAWYGHGNGPWSGYPSVETAPEVMLQTFSPDELVHAIERRPLSAQHLEGIARFVARWVPVKSKQNRRRLKDLIDKIRESSVCDQIHAHVQSGRDPSKTEQLRRAFD